MQLFSLNNKGTLLVLAIVTIYLISRLLFLTTPPLLGDEGDYIYTALLGYQNGSLLFESLAFGKQPLFFWTMNLSFHILNDPVVARRIVSIVAGGFTMLILSLLAYELFHKKSIS